MSKNKNFAFLILLLVIVSIATMASLRAASTKSNNPTKHENPTHGDRNQEIARLRSEGIAHYESGIGQKKALELFKKILSLNDKSAIDQYNVGLGYYKSNNTEQAKAHFIRAIELDSKFPHPHYMLGLMEISVGAGREKDALASFSKAASLASSDASAHYQLSRVYRETGQADKALQAIIETLNLDPYHTGALYQLYLYHQQSGDKEKSEQIFQEFSRLKKAIGKTRKEINPDEDELAKPLNDDPRRLKKPFAAQLAKPQFKVGQLPSMDKVQAFAVVDLDDDNDEDVITVSSDGALYAHINDNGNFKFKVAGPTFKGKSVLQVAVAKLKREAGYSLLAVSSEGVDIVAIERNEVAANTVDKILLKPLHHISSDTPLRWLNLFDIDHDGDIDLVGDAFQNVWLNRGDGLFDFKPEYIKSEDKRALHRMSPKILGSDLRNMIAVDLAVFDAEGQRWILRDDMGGQYSLLKKTLINQPKILWADVADMDNDGFTDIVSISDMGLSIDYNLGNLQFKSVKIGKTGASVRAALIFDFNNDGHKDIVFQDSQGQHIQTNSGNRTFAPSESIAKNFSLSIAGVIDANNDGLTDIIGLSAGGSVMLLENRTKIEKNHWIKVKLDGIRSAPDGRYTQLEVRYGGYYAKYEAHGDIVQIPLGGAPYAEILRISWPNGFVENKFKVDAGATWKFSESERISGSCPSIYAWDGTRYQYITDAFISGPMGVPMGPGKYFPIDDDEYIRIPGEQMRPDERGYYKVSIVEELKEVTYLDQIKLYAVDYPAYAEMYPNEYLLPPHSPEFKLHLTSRQILTVPAADHHGNDVSELIKEMDYRYPHAFERSRYTGFAEENGIELKLPNHVLHGDKLRLFLTGWFYYFDSTSLIAASQQPEHQFIWPQVQVFRAGRWEFLKKIGIPSGKEKTVVVDLSGSIPADAESIRVWSNVELYWDRILVDAGAEPKASMATMHELVSSASRLRFHGFSEMLKPETGYPMPDRFNYHKVNYHSMWDPLTGNYTRYGTVDPLLKIVDSQMVVFGSGDELSISFDAKKLPALKSGYRRDFLLYLNGYVKDGDKYTAHAGQVDPMPYAGLPAYPYTPEQQQANGPDEKEHAQYLLNYQSRQRLVFTQPVAPEIATADTNNTQISIGKD